MKTLHDVPADLGDRDADRALPPGGGLLIAVALSILFWGILVWMVLRR
jgi:hypothetical protein